MQFILGRFPMRIIYWNLEVGQCSSWYDRYYTAVSSYVCICAIVSCVAIFVSYVL